MTRCERCDRPRFSPSSATLGVDVCPGDRTADCRRASLTIEDWRQRALAAEARAAELEIQRDAAKAWHPRMNHCSFCGKAREKALYLISGPVVFICDGCVGLCVDILDEKPIRRWDYEDIARRALVAGLAEATRLRNTTGLCRACTGPGGVYDMLDEQAIRVDERERLLATPCESCAVAATDAARAEREAVVAFLNAGAADGDALLDGSASDESIRKIANVLRAAAMRIQRGDHAKGGR